ncbi:hypothetical protein Fcan01_10522 [Folsomia candida]|uniref:Gustatory receptor n=1 Tax=Folsomia candida TaxID=158441 RepID=A0A226E9M8_FOLCA|nr:hypothetical protein Fcan01_10522 [Folsomia candida]
MFSPKVLRIIRSVIKFLEKTRLFPFAWDDARNKMTVIRSKATIIYSTIYCWHYPFYICFTLVQLLHSIQSSTQKGITDTYWLIMMTVGFRLISVTMYGPLLKRNLQVAYFNQIVGLDEMITKLSIPGSSRIMQKSAKWVELVIKTNVLAALTSSIFMNGIFLLKPSAPQYIYSVWPYKTSTCAFLIFTGFEFYTKTINLIATMLFQAWFLCAIMFEYTALCIIRKSKDPVSTRITYYKCVNLVNTLHNESYPTHMLPERIAFFGFLAVTSAFVVVRLLHNFQIVEQVLVLQFLATMLIIPSVILSLSGQIVKLSGNLKKELEQSIVNGKNFKLHAKMVKSLRPFGVRIAPIQTVHSYGFPVYLGYVVSNFTTVLVNYAHLE